MIIVALCIVTVLSSKIPYLVKFQAFLLALLFLFLFFTFWFFLLSYVKYCPCGAAENSCFNHCSSSFPLIFVLSIFLHVKCPCPQILSPLLKISINYKQLNFLVWHYTPYIKRVCCINAFLWRYVRIHSFRKLLSCWYHWEKKLDQISISVLSDLVACIIKLIRSLKINDLFEL